MEQGDVAKLLGEAVEQLEQGRGRTLQMHRQHRRLAPPRQGQGAGRPGRVGQDPAGPAGDAAGGKDHDGAPLVQGRIGQGEGQAGPLAGALGLHPLHRDEHLAQARIDAQGVGVGEEHQVGTDRAKGVVYGHAVREPGGMVDDHDRRSAAGQPLQPARRHLQRQQPRDVVERLAPAHARHRIRHGPGLAVAEQAIERRAQQQPRRRSRQPRRAFLDQHVDDVIRRR